MHVGDIEGKGTIYDEEGHPILEEDESIVHQRQGFCRKGEKRLHMHWRTIFFDGAGCFFFTDRRIIFLREPAVHDSPAQFSFDRLASLSDHEYWTNRSNLARLSGAREFFEVEYEELETVKHRWRSSKLVARAAGTKYKFTIDDATGAALEEAIENGECNASHVCFEKAPAE